LYVKADPLLTFDAYLARVVAPIDRFLGTTLLTEAVISQLQTISTFHSTGGGGSGGTFTGTATGR
jgi:hypothetical protein